MLYQWINVPGLSLIRESLNVLILRRSLDNSMPTKSLAIQRRNAVIQKENYVTKVKQDLFQMMLVGWTAKIQ